MRKRRRRRSTNQILQEILSICAKGENITQIVYRSNTNFTTAGRIIKSLRENDLVEEIDGSPVIYKTTSKGMVVKDRLKMLQNELNGLIAK